MAIGTEAVREDACLKPQHGSLPIGVILGLYIEIMENKMETTIMGYIGLM